jgi:hypothetical protein
MLFQLHFEIKPKAFSILDEGCICICAEKGLFIRRALKWISTVRNPCIMVHIWQMEPDPCGDRRLPHHVFPPKTLTVDQLKHKFGILCYKVSCTVLFSHNKVSNFSR